MSKVTIPNWLQYVVAYPLIGLVYLMFWYAEYFQGVEPKTGQAYYKHRTVDGKTYFKRKGLYHLLNRWELCKHPKGRLDLDINSMYPVQFRMPTTDNAKLSRT